MSSLQTTIEAPVTPVRRSKVDYSQGPQPVSINPTWCKKCNICVALCPQNVLDTDRSGKPVVAHAEECIQCGICWTHCPDAAITSNYR